MALVKMLLFTGRPRIWYLVQPKFKKKKFLKVEPGTKCEKVVLLVFSTDTNVKNLIVIFQIF
jgi:hypothetical protein